MADQTTTATAEQDEALAALERKMADYRRTHAALEAAREAKNAHERNVLGGALANRAREIRELRLDLAEDGVETSWDPPRSVRSKAKPSMSKDEIELKLQKAATVFRNTKDEEMKAGADARIKSLLAKASKAGYQVKDPR